MFDFLILGAIGIDTNVYLHGNAIDWTQEANFTENLDYVGGAGGYCSRMASQLGYTTAFTGFIGDDFQGEFILNELRKDNVNIEGIFKDPAGSKRSVNIVYKNGQRKNFYDAKGSMDTIPNLEIVKNLLYETKIAHFAISNWTRYAIADALKFVKVVSVDLQDISNFEDVYHQDYIKNIDILFFSSSNLRDPSSEFQSFTTKYPNKIVIMTMGEKGCMTFHNQKIKHHEAVDLDEPIIDTNGAGDSVAIGFLSGYFIEGLSFDEAILNGQVLARINCTRRMTSNFPTKEYVSELRGSI